MTLKVSYSYLKQDKQHTRNQAMTTYVIIDIQTKAQVGKVYTERKRASAQANRLDMKYGAIRYVVKSIYADEV